MTLSRRKGKDAELELAAELRRLGFTDARRGQQYHGLEGRDVVGVEGVRLECKRVEALNLYAALDQVMADADGEVPVVAHRRSRRPWVLVVPLDLSVSFAVRWLRALGYRMEHGAERPRAHDDIEWAAASGARGEVG